MQSEMAAFIFIIYNKPHPYMKKLIRLTDGKINKIVNESVIRTIGKNVGNRSLIEEALFNGSIYNVNNEEGYDVGVGCENIKEFYNTNSSAMEYSYCHTTVEDINVVVNELENMGYEFEHDCDGYVYMKGERKKPFKPRKIKCSINGEVKNLNPFD